DNVASFPAAPRLLGAQRITRCEPGRGIVGADFHDHLAADAVRLDDTADGQLQGSSMSSAPLLVGVHHVDADTAATDAGDQRAQPGRRAAPGSDHLAQIVGVDVHFDGPPAAAVHHVHPNVIGVVDNPANQMLNGVNDDRTHFASQLSVVGSACSPPSAGVSAGFSVDSASAGATVGLGQCGVEQLELARLGRGDLQAALHAGQAFELLPVAGDLQQLQDGFGGLSTHGQPVLGALGVDLD